MRKFCCARSFFLVFFSMPGSQTREILRQLSHEASSFSSLPLFSFPFFYAVPLRSPFPHLGALLSKIYTRYFRHSRRIRSKARNKEKKKNINSTDRKRDLPLRFRAFLTGYTRMIFRVAPGFLDFPPFLVRRRIAKML